MIDYVIGEKISNFKTGIIDVIVDIIDIIFESN